MDNIKVLEMLRVFVGCLGAIPVVWGVYDLFFGENHATSGANKKILGGIAFSAIAIGIMTGVISEMKKIQNPEKKSGENYSHIQILENKQLYMIDGYDEVENILKIS